MTDREPGLRRDVQLTGREPALPGEKAVAVVKRYVPGEDVEVCATIEFVMYGDEGSFEWIPEKPGGYRIEISGRDLLGAVQYPEIIPDSDRIYVLNVSRIHHE